MTINVATVAQMQALEDASERAGVSKDTLMENAGLACAQYVRERLGGCAGRRVAVLVGPGNNGADGLVIARHLRRWGAEVVGCIVRGRPNVDPKMTDALAADVTVVNSDDDPDLHTLASRLSRSDLVIDAILGAGRYRPPDGIVADVIGLVNRRRHQRAALSVVAIDLPTGVNPDTGAANAAGIQADATLALCFPKFGIANFPGAGYAGRITVVDIGLPESVVAAADLPTQWMTRAASADLLPHRPLDSHKGTYGHLLIVAGSRHFVGAAALAALAAHRVGAGLVTLATPESVYPLVAARLTETIHLPLPEDPEGRIDPSAADIINERIDSYSALAVGCGTGLSAGTTKFIDLLLLNGNRHFQSSSRHSGESRNPSLPIVIDADGLNNLSRCENWPARLPANTVLTPHPGEMATLTGQATPDIQAGRLTVAADSAAQWNQTVLLKGAHSIVASPDGRQCILPFANPALAAGGTGDVLTGIIGGLLAQGLPSYDAARLGGFLHGTAADEIRAATGDAGVVASDLLPHLPTVIADLRR
ncbi:MAG: NAD(P)H-hydrate dehydratase [Chloroflexi bacterium]|nr:NAD(P)H-hydrate dehydratase [Chloroflexota bacterium]MYD49509.1 NAD(P)H-hydrate dehydratase [Chloroflexota bacterium]